MDNDVIQQMDYWVGERGMSGPRLFTTGSTMGQAAWLDDPKTKPAWAYMTEQRIPVCDRIAWGSHYPANEGTLGSLVSLSRRRPSASAAHTWTTSTVAPP
jgi:hypothetical protein